MTAGPLARFTVLDLTRVRAGPTAVRYFADWGANVIKIEMPDRGEGGEGLGGPRNGLPQVPSIYVGKCLHASAPRILSRVIGKSFMRRPIALLTALAIAAGDKALPDSPTLFAP